MVDEPKDGEEKDGEEKAQQQPSSLKAEPEEGHWDDVHALHDPVMREHARPRDGFEPISVWLVFIFMAFVAWGGWYLGAYSASFRADVIDIIPLEEQALAPEVDDLPPDEVDPMVLGEQVYTNCAPCHQADGQGVVGAFPPLTDNARVQGDPRPFAALLIDGLHGPLEVDGVAYDEVMPGWGQLQDQELAAVMTYVRQSFGNDADPVDADLVAQVRQATDDRDELWTDQELEEFDWQAIDEPDEPDDEPDEPDDEPDEPDDEPDDQ